jgi:hypothetical protein
MLAALLVGFVVGTAFGAYLLFAVVTPTMLKGGATPQDLYFDPSGNFPQYRDYYAARAAARFAALGGAASEAALTAARDELGVTTGEVSPATAAAMVRGASDVAAKENAAEQNPDAGRFTLQDQQNLSALSDRLTATQGDVVAAAQSADASLDLLRIGGLIGLVVLILCAALVLWLLTRALGPRDGVPDVTSDAETTPSPAPPARPARRVSVRPAPATDSQASPPASADIVAPDTNPGAPRMRSAPAPASTADSPLRPTTQTGATPARAAAGEQLVGTFDAIYDLSTDKEHFDNGFPIQAGLGELIGECGATVIERIDVDSPARVVALAVWLFDKADFQSTTKVLMTDFVFADAAVRDKLRNRGDAIPARLGSFDIVTSSLRAEVEVVDVQFGAVGATSNGYFERLALHFTVFRR